MPQASIPKPQEYNTCFDNKDPLRRRQCSIHRQPILQPPKPALLAYCFSCQFVPTAFHNRQAFASNPPPFIFQTFSFILSQKQFKRNIFRHLKSCMAKSRQEVGYRTFESAAKGIVPIRQSVDAQSHPCQQRYLSPQKVPMQIKTGKKKREDGISLFSCPQCPYLPGMI